MLDLFAALRPKLAWPALPAGWRAQSLSSRALAASLVLL